MVTAMHDISIALEAIRAGAYDYILKPFEKDQLHLSVGRALEHRRLVMENRTYQSGPQELVEERTQQLSDAMQDLDNLTITLWKLWGRTLDAKDAETEGHCQRVTALRSHREVDGRGSNGCCGISRAARSCMISARWAIPDRHPAANRVR